MNFLKNIFRRGSGSIVQEPMAQTIEPVVEEEIAYGSCGDGMTWRLECGVLYIEGRGEIAGGAFADKENIYELVIAPGCSGIGEGAFQNCDELRKAALPTSIEWIGESAFEGCIMLEMCVPDSVVYIGDYAFDGVEDVDYRGPARFGGEWGDGGWYGENWRIGNDTLYVNVEGALPLQDFEDVGMKSPWYLKEHKINHVIIAPGCTVICRESFKGALGIESISIPDTVRQIEREAFSGCKGLRAVVIPEGIEEINSGCFCSCEALESISLPSTLKRIGDDAFSRCEKLSSIRIPESVTQVGEKAFSGCTALGAVEIPTGVKRLGLEVFFNCSGLQSLRMAEGLEKIEKNACRNCSSLKSLKIPASVKALDASALIAVPAEAISVAEDERAAYYIKDGMLFDRRAPVLLRCLDDKRGSIAIPEGTDKIGEHAFHGCKNIRELLFPATITEIGPFAFWGCTGLRSLNLPRSIDKIAKFAFSGCSALTHVEVPGNIKELGAYAFFECKGLRSVCLHEGLEIIGEAAFRDCKELRDIKFPETLKEIKPMNFAGCEHLRSVYVPAGVTKLYNNSFGKAHNMTEIVVDENNCCFSSTGGVLFDKAMSVLICCPAGKKGRYFIPEGVDRIVAEAFYHCAKLKKIMVPESVSVIGRDAFGNVAHTVYSGAWFRKIAALKLLCYNVRRK